MKFWAVALAITAFFAGPTRADEPLTLEEATARIEKLQAELAKLKKSCVAVLTPVPRGK